ncbi:MAG: TonB-dependent receptor [Gemmatimonadales bacterium]
MDSLRLLGIFAVVSLVPAFAYSQQDSTPVRLDSVVVTVTRSTGRSVLGSPFAVTIVQPDSTRPGQRHIAIDETLAMIPGLVAVNRNNPSQDSRLSIRGFGARSAFGVRGIKVLRDGMPLTLPDGQTPTDYLSLESVGRIEVMRGAASALYGNASGGVIDLRTAAPSTNRLSADATQWVGSHDSFRTAVAASGSSNSLDYVADAAQTRSDGERAHSKQRATTGFLRSGVSFRGNDIALTVLALDNPLAENPGALTKEEMEADSRTADALSVRRDARKTVKQFQLGLSAIRAIGNGDVSISGFGGARSLDNPLTFAVVEVGRHTYGAAGTIRQAVRAIGLRHHFVAGTDIQWQNDLRRNYAACADTVPVLIPTTTCPNPPSERGVVTLDQRELVSGAGLYVSDEVDLGRGVSLTAGLRGDRIRFRVRDRLISATNPDDSGRRLLTSVSPIAGVVARYAPTHSAYANFSAAFETPTATELGNHADGTAGINQDLDPQRSRTIEAGMKGFAGSRIRYDAALFDTRVRDELVPFEILNSNGRRFFRNAGRTTRRGVELGGEASAGMVGLLASYSYSRFRFDRYTVGTTSFAGSDIPAVPHHRLQAAVRAGNRLGFAILESETAGKSFADDANSVIVNGYTVAHFRVGVTPVFVNPRLSLTLGVQNLFDRLYASSIAVNATRGKYYEPAQGRSFNFGIAIGGQTTSR